MTQRARQFDRKDIASAVAITRASVSPALVLALNTLVLLVIMVLLFGAGWMHAT